MRIAVEDGLVAGVLWLGITGLALVRRPLASGAWWMMAAVVLLGMLDYYTWMGHLVGVWWLCLGALLRKKPMQTPNNQ